MSLKVLLADDNITAQRMGSKILTDAGYTVVPVSNGAAAVKKIASEKPELIILDVYMPGFTGLEVCDKVKRASETAGVPVLLTVTSMEPYSPEDGNRVKADGVLIKPFEATDLLAVVRKFEDKLNAPPVPEKFSRMLPVEEISDQSYNDWKIEVGLLDPLPPEMSREVATGPVLGFDDLPETPPFAMDSMPAPVAVESQTTEVNIFDPNAPEPAFDLQQPSAAGEIPLPAGMEFASAPPVDLPEVAPAAEFEPTMQAAGDALPILQEPALATEPSDFEQFITKFGQAHPEDVPVGVAMETQVPPEHHDMTAALNEFLDRYSPLVVPEPAPDAAKDSDFEPQALVEDHTAEPAGIVEHETAAPPEMHRAFETSGGAAAAAAPAMESAPPQPEVGSDTQRVGRFADFAPLSEIVAPPEIVTAPEPVPEPEPEIVAAPELAPEPVPEIVAAPELAPEPVPEIVAAPEPAPESHELPEVAAEAAPVEVASAVEAVQQEAPPAESDIEPTAAAATAIAMDEQQIAAAVDRVLERYKDVLVAAIVRELKH